MRKVWGIGSARLRHRLRQFWRETDRDVKHKIVTALALLIVSSVLTALAPTVLKRVVDGLGFDRQRNTNEMLVLVAAYVVCLWFGRTLGEARAYIYSLAEKQTFRNMSARMFEHILDLPLAFHLDSKTGGVIQTLENGLQGYQRLAYHLVFTLIPVAVELTTIGVVFLYFDHPEFLVIFAITVVFYSVTFLFTSSRVAQCAARASAAKVMATATMTDGVMNYETTKYFTAEDPIARRTRNALDRSHEEWKIFHATYTQGMLVVAAVFASFILATAALGVHEVAAGNLTVGGFILVNTYMIQLARPIEMVGNAVQGVLQGAALLEKMLDILELKTEASTQSYSEKITGSGGISIESLNFAYQIDQPLLRDISFQVPAGKAIGIAGPSGSGKSTLIRLITRLLTPQSGQIRIDGVSVDQMAVNDLRSVISVIPQDVGLFDDTIGYNISLGKPSSSLAEIVAAAEIAGLHEFISGLPEGYDTQVGERGIKLSGGERQRVAIARAVLRNPKIFLFDEATSSLDPLTEKRIMDNIRAASEGCTTVVIAHRLSTLVNLDRIVVLDRGEIVESGTHSELLMRMGTYYRMWTAQSSWDNSDVAVSERG